jgi:hypothetical protein
MARGPEVQVPVHPLDEAVVQLAERGWIARSDDAIDKRDDCGFVGTFE